MKDQSGNTIGCSGWCFVNAWNNDGSAEGQINSSGNFSFYVPAGTVNVVLGSNSYGFMLRDDHPNTPIQPRFVSPSPTITWTSTDGPLNFKLPNTVAVNVNVTSGGVPVAGADVRSESSLTSSSNELLAANGSNPAVNATFTFNPSSATTDANGDAVITVYETDAQTFTISASGSFNGVNLSGSMTDVPADGQSHSIAFTVPGALSYSGEYANAPYLTSLAVRNAANSAPIGFQPTFSSLHSVYSAASVDAGTSSVEIDSATSDPTAVVTTYGDTNLVPGKNFVTVQIADPVSGSARSYTIAVDVAADPPPTSSTSTSTSSSSSTTSSSTPSSTSTSTPSSSSSSSSSTTLVGGASTSTTQPVAQPTPSEATLQSLPSSTLTTEIPKKGKRFRISHGGFTPGDRVSLYVASTPVLLGTGIADANGVVAVEGELPADLEAGEHTLALLSSDGTVGFSQAITVSADDTSGGLPFTGSDSRTLLILAAGLLSLGALGTTAARRAARAAN